MPKAASFDAQSERQIESFIDRALQQSGIPGISVALYAAGKTFCGARGVSDVISQRPLTTESRFDMGSINQFFVALLVLQLSTQGRIDLEQPLSRYLPELAGPNGDRVRVRHLLSHTAGYAEENLADPDIAQAYSYAQLVENFNARAMLFTPGTVFSQSASAYVLLSRIVAAVTGESALRLVRTQVLDRMGGDTPGSHAEGTQVRGHTLDSGGAHVSSSSPWSPVWEGALTGLSLRMRDLMQLGVALVEDDSALLSAEREHLLPDAVRVPRLVRGVCTEDVFSAFGMGCGRYPGQMHGVISTASEQTCTLRFDVRRRVVIALAINANEGWLRDRIVSRLWSSLVPESASHAAQDVAPADAAFDLAELPGRYAGAADHSFDVSLEEEGLILRQGHNPALAADPELIYAALDRKDDAIIPATRLLRTSLAFFRDPASGTPCLQVGAHAFRQMPSS